MRVPHIGAAAAVALLAACHSYVEGNGVYFEEDRTAQLATFVGLRVDDGIQGKLTVGTPARVVVSGDSNIVKSISTTVVGLGDGTSVLDVSVNLDNFTPLLPLGVTVTVPDVRYLSASHASRIDATGASTTGTTSFQVVGSDGSYVTLAGPGGPSLDLVLSGGTHQGAHLDARSYVVTGHTSVALGGASMAQISSNGIVTGTAEAGSLVENQGNGECAVTVLGTSDIVANQCKPPSP